MKTGLAFFSSKCFPNYCLALCCILLHFSCRGWLIPPSPLGQAPKWHCRHHRGWQLIIQTKPASDMWVGCLLSHSPLHRAPYPTEGTQGPWDTLSPGAQFTEALHSLVKVNSAENIKISNLSRELMKITNEQGNLRWAIYHLYSCNNIEVATHNVSCVSQLTTL